MPSNPTLTQEKVREFVIAGHGDFEKVKLLLAESPELLNAAFPWSETDRETALQAAVQVGSAAIAEFLLTQGAPLDICTAAMLGRKADVTHFLDENPESIHAVGAHGIPLLTLAAWNWCSSWCSAAHRQALPRRCSMPPVAAMPAWFAGCSPI